jgi:protein gp37
MKTTKIQWCHSSVNPVMGCDGCELWKSAAAIQAILLAFLLRLTSLSGPLVRRMLAQTLGDRVISEVYRDREAIADQLVLNLRLNHRDRQPIIDVLRHESKCYAGILGVLRAGHNGYADGFEIPKIFPGRMAKAANWGAPTSEEIADKSWLLGLPRLVSISDMGDALSKTIPFEYLRDEIILNANSPAGRKHIWLWLSKRPARMAEFGRWLSKSGAMWPDNLMAMTTVTGPNFAGRVDELRKVPAKLKGLSLEPLFAPVRLNLRGINWLIVGGGSDVLADPFHLEWALDLRRQAATSGVSFFLKQAGKHPFFKDKPLELTDGHGGDWSEWPKGLRVRELPEEFYAWGSEAPIVPEPKML